jgi:hypothetical protein
MALTVPIPNSSALPEPRTEEEALDSMRVLLESGRGKEAQRAAARWTKQFPDSAKLAKWDDVLNFQQSRTGPGTGRDHRADNDWIQEHGQKYPGNWVALRDGVPVATGTNLATVRREYRDLGVDPKEILLWFQPGKPQE